MIDLKIDEMGKKIQEEEEELEEKYNPDSEFHNQILGVLFMFLMMKLYFDGSYKHILKYISYQKKELSYGLLLLSILLMVFNNNDTLKKAIYHGLFISCAHLITESGSLTNLALFAFIGMYHFNSVETE